MVYDGMDHSNDSTRRIYELQAIIKQIERHHVGGTSAKKQKQELEALLKQQP
jgi:hypothetical protein